jgi:hypothetical protein
MYHLRRSDPARVRVHLCLVPLLGLLVGLRLESELYGLSVQLSRRRRQHGNRISAVQRHADCLRPYEPRSSPPRGRRSPERLGRGPSLDPPLLCLTESKRSFCVREPCPGWSASRRGYRVVCEAGPAAVGGSAGGTSAARGTVLPAMARRCAPMASSRSVHRVLRLRFCPVDFKKPWSDGTWSVDLPPLALIARLAPRARAFGRDRVRPLLRVGAGDSGDRQPDRRERVALCRGSAPGRLQQRLPRLDPVAALRAARAWTRPVRLSGRGFDGELLRAVVATLTEGTRDRARLAAVRGSGAGGYALRQRAVGRAGPRADADGTALAGQFARDL